MNNSYATALFEIALEDNALDLCEKSFVAFIENYEHNRDFMNFFNSPNVGIADKKALIKEAFKECYFDFVNFLYVVIDNHRETLIKEIYDDFIHLYCESQKIKMVKVVSSKPLSNEEREVLTTSLTKYFKGYKIDINNDVDESIISGYRLFADGKRLNLNAKDQLDNLKAKL